MSRAVVFLTPGYEEAESLTLVSVLRQAGIETDIASYDAEVVGAHEMAVKADRILGPDFDVLAYDLLVLPGGYGQADHLKNDAGIQNWIRQMDQNKHLTGSLCASPIALEASGVLDGRRFTAYRGIDEKIKAGTYQNQLVVQDGHLITSQGPACAYALAFELVKALGTDPEIVKEQLGYQQFFAGGSQ